MDLLFRRSTKPCGSPHSQDGSGYITREEVANVPLHVLPEKVYEKVTVSWIFWWISLFTLYRYISPWNYNLIQFVCLTHVSTMAKSHVFSGERFGYEWPTRLIRRLALRFVSPWWNGQNFRTNFIQLSKHLSGGNTAFTYVWVSVFKHPCGWCLTKCLTITRGSDFACCILSAIHSFEDLTTPLNVSCSSGRQHGRHVRASGRRWWR